jgi:hypothetical protein
MRIESQVQIVYWPVSKLTRFAAIETQIAIDHRPIGVRKNRHEIPVELFASLLGG